jgi:hypothetical protein
VKIVATPGAKINAEPADPRSRTSGASSSLPSTQIPPAPSAPPQQTQQQTQEQTRQQTQEQTRQQTQEQTRQQLLGQQVSPLPVAQLPIEERAGLTTALFRAARGAPTGQGPGPVSSSVDAGGARPRELVAAIDLGSSSAKMVVLRRTPTGFTTLLDTKIGCGLGKGVAVGAPIPEDNQQRAIAALQTFAAQAAALGVDVAEIPVITTAVVRNASDGAAFAARLGQQTGLQVRVLSGEEEADVGFRGALGARLQTPGRYATLDLGGGSFQLAVGSEAGLEEGASTQVGSNHVLDVLLAPHADSSGRLGDAAFDAVDRALAVQAPMPLSPARLQGATILGTGGVSKFLRAHLGTDTITTAAIDGLRRQVGALSLEARVALVQGTKDDVTRDALGIGTEAGALDYGKKLPASLSLLLHILRGASLSEVTVSETDARHALALAVGAPR